MKRPKTIDKFDESALAGAKLIQLALDNVLSARPGVKVRWAIQIHYWNDDWLDPDKTKDMKVIPSSGSFSNL